MVLALKHFPPVYSTGWAPAEGVSLQLLGKDPTKPCLRSCAHDVAVSLKGRTWYQQKKQ